MQVLADLAIERGGNINRILSPSHASDGVDVHQLNITYFSALGLDEDRYLAARAIQLFARGIPQLYYVGLACWRQRPRLGRLERRWQVDQPPRLRAS